MRVVLALVVAVVVGGLFAAQSLSAPSSQAQICQAASTLTAAREFVGSAVAADKSGDATSALPLAERGATAAADAHAELQAIRSDDTRRTDAWQRFLDAYLHLGQAANAMLPGYENSHDLASEEFQRGAQSLDAARTALPASCFVAPAQ